LDPDRETLGWVLYDAACGFCTWWIPFWRKTIQKAGYDIAPLQAAWVRAKTGLEGPSVNRDILLLMKDGTLVHGADAYIFGMKRVWWSSPLGHLMDLPGMKQLTWVFYRWFNRNRFFVSNVCRLSPADIGEVH
jgi:predicted DCC family thiol-disulfide oxidoreductase YuxK